MPTALITGSAHRLGAAIALRLHQSGYQIMLHYGQSEVAATKLCRQLNQSRPESAATVQYNLTNLNAMATLIEQTQATFGGLDVLVNNASEFRKEPFAAMKPQQALKTLQCNTLAPLFLSQAAAPYLKATGGCIINLLDIHAEKPLKDHLIYSASKAALQSMTLALAQELAPEVRVNAIAPGAILLPEQAQSDKVSQVLNAIPLQKLGNLEDIAEAALYLVMQAKYTTGQTLVVDGGRSAQGYLGCG
jgi:pteridine reductase